MKAGLDHIGVGCGAVILDSQKRILVQLRSKNSKIEAETWSIPGGKVEIFETRAQACLREVAEEIGCMVQIDKELLTIDHIVPDEKQHWVTTHFLCHITEGEPKIMEPLKHDALEWHMISELENMSVMSHMVPLLKKLKALL